MRLPRPQFSLRWMMIAVAVAGFAFGGLVLAQRSRANMVIAQTHAAEATDFAETVDAEDLDTAAEAERVAKIGRAKKAGDLERVRDRQLAMPTCGPMHPSGIKLCRAMAAYHTAMKAKYERAARYPWLHVAPDPPEPEL